MSLLHDILKWREQQATQEGIENYRVLSKSCIEAIVYARPTTKEALVSIKGIKEAKYRKYGQAIFALVQGKHDIQKTYSVEEIAGESVAEGPLSVSLFLDSVNTELSGLAARIKGEVTSVSMRPRVIYFTMKDPIDESTLDCLMWRSQYEVAGVEITVGDEIIVEGVPEVYKPTGRLSLKAYVLEVSGEGALKKVYDELYKKLEQKGCFASINKKVLPLFPRRIGLITSLDGAAIGDFRMNLGHFGFQVLVYPSSVEGKRAVFELLEAIRYFEKQKKQVDVLVIIRGGGSLESLQAFNTESLVDAIYACPIPTLLGVGHEKDVTLAALAADQMESTPTACAKVLSAPYLEAREQLNHRAFRLESLFQESVYDVRRQVETALSDLSSCLDMLKDQVMGKERRFIERALSLQYLMRAERVRMGEQGRLLSEYGQRALLDTKQYLVTATKRLNQYDPVSVLKLGYSLVQKHGSVIKSSKGLSENDILHIRFAEGGVTTQVKKID